MRTGTGLGPGGSNPKTVGAHPETLGWNDLIPPLPRTKKLALYPGGRPLGEKMVFWKCGRPSSLLLPDFLFLSPGSVPCTLPQKGFSSLSIDRLAPAYVP